MNTREALLRGIGENPDDEATKLVYADFLEESGNEEDVARARLIRLGIRLFREDLCGEESDQLSSEYYSLWDQYHKQWLHGLPEWVVESHSKCGFLESVFCTPKKFLKSGQAILDREPLIELVLVPTSEEGEMTKLANSPFLSRLCRAAVMEDAISNQWIEIFLRSPHLTGLRRITLAFRQCPIEFLTILASEPKFGSLRTLDLAPGYRLGVEGIRELTKSKTLCNLESLSLFGEGCDESAQLLAESILFQKLKTLDFVGNSSRETLTKKGFKALTCSPDLGRLEILELDGNLIGDEGLAILEEEDRPWPNLKSLSLSKNQITSRGLYSLSRAPFPKLEILELGENSIGDEELARLEEHTPWPNLKSLSLSKNQITDRGLHSLSRVPFPKLEILRLDANPIQGEGIASILKAFTDQRLRELSLGGCKIDDAGLRAITETGANPPLKVLDLANNSFFGEGCKKILFSPMVRELRYLNLNGNQIGDEGGIAIGESAYLRNLDGLYIDGCGISDKTLIALGKSPNLAKLWRLILNANRFTAEGIRALAQSPYLTKVSEISIDDAGLEDDSASALVESPYLNPSRLLSLVGNSFGNKAYRALKKRFSKIDI
jgi:uncharacterized protein (TIGR02996 family)